MFGLNSGKRISINIISSIIQIISVGLIYLLLYRFLIKNLGIEQLGVWSIILATTSVANLANFGITSGLVKFVAEYNATDKLKTIPKLIFTSFLAIAVFYALIVFIIYIFGSFFLDYIIDKKYVYIGLEILPYSLMCLYVNSLSGVFTSTLEGFQKNYIRNLLMFFSSFVFLFLSYYLVVIHGLKGVAVAQLAQALVILIGSFVYLKFTYKFKIFYFRNWDLLVFKELMGFGLKFQVISLFQMFYEPITKALISKFGGMTLLGYYEMAARLVNQIRALLVSANQVMVPVVAHTKNTNNEDLEYLYKKTMDITFFINVILMTSIIIFAPLISELWIGHIEGSFTFSMITLSISMFINIISGPAYFSSIGEGKLNSVVVSHIILGVLNLILGFFLGNFFGGKAVIISWGISVILSSIYLIYFYQKSRGISFKIIFDKSNVLMILISVLISLLSLHVYEQLRLLINSSFVVIVIYSLLIFVSYLPFIVKNKELMAVLKKMVS